MIEFFAYPPPIVPLITYESHMNHILITYVWLVHVSFTAAKVLLFFEICKGFMKKNGRKMGENVVFFANMQKL